MKKNVTHIPQLRVGQYLLLFDISYYLKISLICSIWTLDIKKNFALAKNRNAKNLKIKFQQRRIKSKCSIHKKTNILPILYYFHHQNLNVGMYFYLFAIISRKEFGLLSLFLLT